MVRKTKLIKVIIHNDIFQQLVPKNCKRRFLVHRKEKFHKEKSSRKTFNEKFHKEKEKECEK